MEYGATGEEPTFTEVDLAQLAEQLVLSSAARRAAGASVETADLPVVHADPDDMYSVLQNLLTNSVKFARPGVPAARAHLGPHAPDAWRISFRDNGVGIPEDRRVDVFSLFSRAHSDVEGHGIGLATVARIVASHGGEVGADAVTGGGAEIWFDLPDDDARAEPLARISTPGSRSPGARPYRAPATRSWSPPGVSGLRRLT